jgi:hypothetical protein
VQLFGQNLTAALNVTYFCCVLEQESLANVTSTWAESPPYPVWISSRSLLLHHDSHLSRICVRKHVLLSVDRCSSISLQTLDLSFTCGRCGIYTCRHINVQVHLIIPLPRNKLCIPFSFSHFRFQSSSVSSSSSSSSYSSSSSTLCTSSWFKSMNVVFPPFEEGRMG